MYLAYCRSGFEKECAKELASSLARRNITGYPKFVGDTGYVGFHTHDNENDTLKLDVKSYVFSRQLFYVEAMLEDLPEKDKATPITEVILNYFANQDIRRAFNDVRVEYPDTNDGRELKMFCKKFLPPLSNMLKKNKLFRKPASELVIHVFFASYQKVYIGFSLLGHSSSWALGIPRLKFPKDAPSRSTLKLDEAFMELLYESEREEYLSDGHTACDLGASPGGWSYQFIHRNIYVTAVDNGPMDKKLMATGLLEHIQEDAFKYKPKTSFDWLVCDMVESPMKVAKLICHWINSNWCKYIILNLKLPMNKRFEELQKCIEFIEDNTDGKYRREIEIRAKQLYHDRKEATLFIRNQFSNHP